MGSYVPDSGREEDGNRAEQACFISSGLLKNAMPLNISGTESGLSPLAKMNGMPISSANSAHG
jgi:hypothetical protein